MKHNSLLFSLLITALVLGCILPRGAAGSPSLTISQAYGWMDLTAHLPEPDMGLSDVHFLGNEGWITGGFEEVYYTPDGGQTFSTQTLPAGAGISNSIFVRSAAEGYLVTSTGKVLYSTDPTNGNWTLIGSPGGTLYSIHFPPSGATGYACGNSGCIYRVTSSSVELDTTISTVTFTSIVFPVSSDQGWLVGENTLRHRIGGGWTADQYYDAGKYCNAIHVIDNQNGWAVGNSGVIIHTTDGVNWDGQINPDVQRRALWGAFFLNASEGWAVGYSGVILHTSNGRYWVVQTNPDPQHNMLAQVFFLNPREGWAVGYNTLLHTTDGGQTWNEEAQGLTEGKLLRAVFAVDSNTVYVGGNGVLLKYTRLELPNRLYLPLTLK